MTEVGWTWCSRAVAVAVSFALGACDAEPRTLETSKPNAAQPAPRIAIAPSADQAIQGRLVGIFGQLDGLADVHAATMPAPSALRPRRK